MDESTSREKVFKAIRNASISKTDNPYTDIDFNGPIYQEMTESLDLTFAQEFTRIAGKFVFCENDHEFIENLRAVMEEQSLKEIFCTEPRLCNLLDSAGIPYNSTEDKLKEARAGLGSCEYLIARLGSIMVSSRQASGRRMVVYPELHLVHAYSSQLVPDLQEALNGLRERYINNMPSMVSVISGPSRTADIEKTLVMGAHGPKEVYVFLVDKEEK
jgi:L-lactate dehydrogenase complex protein LldG